MHIQNPDERSFYEIESRQQQWSVRQLKRQVGSSLYERLALSRDKDDVMRLAQEGQTVEKPSDIIKNPITLEFLGLKPDAAYMESNLENTILGHTPPPFGTSSTGACVPPDLKHTPPPLAPQGRRPQFGHLP